MKTVSLAALACLVAASPQDADKDRLRHALGDNDLIGTWIYDDLPAGYAEAKKSGKPIMAVIRCVP